METWFVYLWEGLRKQPPSCASEFPLVFLCLLFHSPSLIMAVVCRPIQLGRQYQSLKDHGRSQNQQKLQSKERITIKCQVEFSHHSGCWIRIAKDDVAAACCHSMEAHRLMHNQNSGYGSVVLGTSDEEEESMNLTKFKSKLIVKILT